MREPDLILRPKQPLVYAWIDRDEKTVIYVGASRVGLVRPLAREHRAYSQGYLLQVWYCSSASEAAELEKYLIRKLQPTLNERLINQSLDSRQPKSESQTRERVYGRTPRPQELEHDRLGAALAFANSVSAALDGITEPINPD